MSRASSLAPCDGAIQDYTIHLLLLLIRDPMPYSRWSKFHWFADCNGQTAIYHACQDNLHLEFLRGASCERSRQTCSRSDDKHTNPDCSYNSTSTRDFIPQSWGDSLWNILGAPVGPNHHHTSGDSPPLPPPYYETVSIGFHVVCILCMPFWHETAPLLRTAMKR